MTPQIQVYIQALDARRKPIPNTLVNTGRSELWENSSNEADTGIAYTKAKLYVPAGSEPDIGRSHEQVDGAPARVYFYFPAEVAAERERRWAAERKAHLDTAFIRRGQKALRLLESLSA